MRDRDWLATRFEDERPQLRRIAYRMLGTLDEADDAVQEAWLRLSRIDDSTVENLGAWLTTVVSRVCLDMLRTRRSRREEFVGSWMPEPIVAIEGGPTPEEEALIADGVGLALYIVLETLAPAERLAFVLHDMFALSFDEIAAIVDRSPEAARQLASRARRRVRGATPPSDTDPAAVRAVVEAFLTAARAGDFDALLTLLDPDVVLRAVTGPGQVIEARGAETVAHRALGHAQLGLTARRALINGSTGWVSTRDGELFSASAVTVRNGRITAMNFISDPGSGSSPYP